MKEINVLTANKADIKALEKHNIDLSKFDIIINKKGQILRRKDANNA